MAAIVELNSSSKCSLLVGLGAAPPVHKLRRASSVTRSLTPLTEWSQEYLTTKVFLPPCNDYFLDFIRNQNTKISSFLCLWWFCLARFRNVHIPLMQHRLLMCVQKQASLDLSPPHPLEVCTCVRKTISVVDFALLAAHECRVESLMRLLYVFFF